MPTQREDSISNKERKLALRTLDCLNIKEEKVAEIVTSFENASFASLIKELLLKRGLRDVYISYTNGPIEEEINKGYKEFLSARIDFYKKRIAEGFIRITILSPFPMPIAKTEAVSLYQKNIAKLSFLNEYLIHAKRCMIVKPNPLWANKLGLTLEELYDKLDSFYEEVPLSKTLLPKINSYSFKELYFHSDEGTDITFSLLPNSHFIGDEIEENGSIFKPNSPSIEIFISPNKYKSNGKIVFTKPLLYKGKLYDSLSITLEDGKVINNTGLDDILSLDPTLSYIGEVALCPYMEGFYYCTLLDENTGSHIALGNAYPYGIIDDASINHSKYHIDLVFGSPFLECDGILEDGSRIPILRKGKVVL